jgi:hypothetical protein
MFAPVILPEGRSRRMSLVYDRRPEMQVGTHALIVGISEYRHLSRRTGPFAELGLGLRSLTSAAISAWAFWQWLNTARLPVPLASCRLMLAPSRQELSREPALGRLHQSCDSDTFIDEISDWREDAASHEENVTFFLFVGHGLMRSRLDQLLLFADIGSGRGRAFQGAVELNSIVYGMVPDDRQFPRMARNQFYFIDASRTLVQEPLRATDVFDVILPGHDDRQIGIFHSALPGALSYAHVDATTLFTAALLDGLQGKAAARIPEPNRLRPSQDERWAITVNSLAAYLTQQAKQQSEEFGIEISYAVSGTFRDTIITEIDSAPLAELKIILSEDFPGPGNIEVKNRRGDIVDSAAIGLHREASFTLPSGLYLVEITGQKAAGTIIELLPPEAVYTFTDVR